MRLETLLPRPLDPCGGSECATLMGALIAAIHLDRRRARALGWRGVRPSGSLLPAWTCRVAGSGLVFGLVFFGEDADGGALRGTFAAYAFPLPDDPLLEVFPLEALRLAVDPGYGDRIRALSEHAETLSPFRIGTVSLRAAVDGSGLSLTLSGALLWYMYMPEEFLGMPMVNPWVYSALLNGLLIVLVTAVNLVTLGAMNAMPSVRRRLLERQY